MHGRQTEQGGLLIRRVVVDVHVRPLLLTHADVLEEVDQGLPLLPAVVRPERRERGFFAGHWIDAAEEVLQAPCGASRLLPHGVTFEIEEDVTGTRWGDGCQGCGVEDVVVDGPGIGLACLEGRLTA